jgi:hypothetical protein
MNKKLFSSFNYLFSKISEKSLSRIAIYLVILVFFISYQFYMLGYIQTIFAATPIFAASMAPAPGLRDKCIPPAVGDWVVDSSCTLTWYSTSWKFRKPITVNNSLTSALTDYQVYLQIETNSLISAGKMNSDCSDIRFTYYNPATQAETLISHWLESGCNTGSTSIWVKVSSIPASGNSTIYMYYGNSGATSTSSGDNTFIFFDDFDDGSLDTTNRWNIGAGTPTESGGILTLNSAGERVYSKSQYGINTALRFRANYPAAGSWIGYETAGYGTSPFAVVNYDATYGFVAYNYVSAAKTTALGAFTGSYHTYDIIRNSTTSNIYNVDNILKATHTTQLSSNNLYIPLVAYAGTAFTVDWIALRNYYSPEPSYIIWHEETIPKNILVKSGGTLNLKTNYNLNFTTFWAYRKPITVSNSGSAQTDYQVNVSSPIYNEAGLVGSWHFNEGSGTSIYDSSGYNNNGTLINGPTWVSGKYGNGVKFDGSNDYVNFGDVLDFERTYPFSISFWAKFNDSTSDMFVIAKQDNFNVGEGYAISRSSSGSIFFYLGNNQNTNALSIATAEKTGADWIHIVVTYNGSSSASGVKIYFNGTQQSTNNNGNDTITATTVTSENLQIGCREGCTFSWFNGTIDEVRIYNRALSSTEISAFYNAKARLDYGDVRFTYYNSTDATETEINYWMQTDGNFWVKVPYVASGSNTIYIYYGNPTATSASNGDQTFLFFDDFTGTVISTDKWVETDNGNYLSQNDKLIATGGSSAWTSNGLYSVANFGRSDSLLAQWEYKPTGGTYFMFGWKDATTGWGYSNLVYGYYDASTVQIYEDGTARGTTYGSWPDNNVYKIKMPMKTDGGVLYQRSSDGGNSWETSYNSNYSTETPLKIGLINYNGAFEIDNLFVRKYASTEPTTSTGTEETNSLTGKYIYVYSGGNIYIYSTAGIQQRV